MVLPGLGLTLSGWGQSPAALSSLAPTAHRVDYMQMPSAEALCTALTGTDCDYAIGWSLGGQLVIRAILAGIIKPKALILLATPYRFLHPDLPGFTQEVTVNPEKALKRFRVMMCAGDSNPKTILKQLPHNSPTPHMLYWLEELVQFDGDTQHCHLLPPTLIIQGGKDSIVPPSQAAKWAEHIPVTQLFLLDQAGHIPQFHASILVHRQIEAFIHDHVR